jgi:pimeloyl-ACP methyl ester carboxylesterase
MRGLAFALAFLTFGLAVAALPSLSRAQPPIILLHGGGWQGGSPGSMQPWEDDFRAHGYTNVYKLAYPFGNVLAAINDVKAQAVALPQPVVAYGISAGGTIAAALAASGDVAGAVNVIGPTDLVNWPTGATIMAGLDMTEEEKRAASPLYRLSDVRPQLHQAGAVDPIVPYDQALRYNRAARRLQSDATLQTLANAHGQLEYERANARNWIEARWRAQYSRGVK